jgi:hypothetical protein
LFTNSASFQIHPFRFSIPYPDFLQSPALQKAGLRLRGDPLFDELPFDKNPGEFFHFGTFIALKFSILHILGLETVEKEACIHEFALSLFNQDNRFFGIVDNDLPGSGIGL